MKNSYLLFTQLRDEKWRTKWRTRGICMEAPWPFSGSPGQFSLKFLLPYFLELSLFCCPVFQLWWSRNITHQLLLVWATSVKSFGLISGCWTTKTKIPFFLLRSSGSDTDPSQASSKILPTGLPRLSSVWAVRCDCKCTDASCKPWILGAQHTHTKTHFHDLSEMQTKVSMRHFPWQYNIQLV